MSGGLDPNMGKEALAIGASMWPQAQAVNTLLGQGGFTPANAPTFNGVGVGINPGGTTAPSGDTTAPSRFQKIASGVGDFSEDFFGSIDNTIQSPAKLLGIGLLNQMGGDRRYGTMGLLAKGAFDAFRGRRERREEESEPTYGGMSLI